MTETDLIIEALRQYYMYVAENDNDKAVLDQIRVLEGQLVLDRFHKRELANMTSIAQLDWADARSQALIDHKAGRPHADGTTEDTRFHPVDEI